MHFKNYLICLVICPCVKVVLTCKMCIALSMQAGKTNKQTKTVAIGLAGKFASLFKYTEKYHMPNDLCAT